MYSDLRGPTNWILCYIKHTFAFFNSDDRSVDAFRQKIESATQMKAVLSADRRPNCLVIDEIDGAPQVTIYSRP